MDNNELDVNSLYDFLICGKSNNHHYILVIVISNQQVVFRTLKRDNNQHWNLAADTIKMMYPNRKFDDNTISDDVVVFTSMGTDLEVDIPDKISAIQLQEIRNILRQAREFEYNYDSTVFMPRDSREIMNEATSKVTEITPCDDEVIIGNKIEKGIVK